MERYCVISVVHSIDLITFEVVPLLPFAYVCESPRRMGETSGSACHAAYNHQLQAMFVMSYSYKHIIWLCWIRVVSERVG